MYTIQENVRIVVALLKEYGIHHIIVSPGGTNIPVTQAVQEDPFFHCYSIADERSAMYFAIGLYLQTGESVVTSCTSAQATRNYIPGLTEAFYKHVPIIAITTSKLSRFGYQDYMQAPDQTSLPKDAVKKSYDLPPVTDVNTRALCCQLAREAISESTHRTPGPVQINIRITDSLNANFEEVKLPVIRKVERYMTWDKWDNVCLEGKKILIVIGEHRPFTGGQISAIEKFASCFNVAIYTNHLSNFHNDYSVNGNLLIASGRYSGQEIIPDIVITIGGQTGDYSIFYALFESPSNFEHWRISEDGNMVDTYCHLTKIFECPHEYFFNRMSEGHKEIIEHQYFQVWNSKQLTLNYNVDSLPLSNLYAAGILSPDIPEGSCINFAILNSLRVWSYFSLKPSVRCFANVAAFGIDGCTSMLLGESVNVDELCFLVTGDLAFFYDMNALGIRHIKNNVRILLVNNNGGAEFKIMTERWKYKPEISSYISAMGHYGQAKGWAEDCGFIYLSAKNKDEFLSAKDKFFAPSKKPVIFELSTKPEDELIANDQFIALNRVVNASSNVKKIISQIIGQKRVETIKKIVK